MLFTPITITSSGVYCFDSGTYNTQITITASDVIVETTPGATPIAIIEPTTPTANAWAYSFGSPTSEIAIIVATPSTSGSTFSALTTSITGVTINNLDVEGTSVSTDIGIYFQNVMSGTISGNTVNNIYPDGYADGAQAGLAILVQSSGASIAASSSVTILNNVVTNYNKNGITCEQAYEGGSEGTTACYVTGNTVTFPVSAQPLIASNGIEFYGTTADSTIIGNSVSGNACTDFNPSDPSAGECGPEAYTSAGILTEATSGVTISGNNVIGSDIGIYMYEDTGPVDVASNTVSGSTYTGILAYDESSTVTISGNTISGTECNNISPNANWGGPDNTWGITTTYTCGADPITEYQAIGINTYGNTGSVTISGNTLTGNDVGIYSYGDTSIVTSTLNTISGSTYTGLVVYDESQTVSGNAFSNEPVGIETVSDTSGLTATTTVGGNTFSSSVTTPTTTETASGGIAETVPMTTFLGCTTTYDPATNVPFQQLIITESGTYCFNAGTYNTQITIETSYVTLEPTPGTTLPVIIQPTTITDNSLPAAQAAKADFQSAIIYVGTGLTGVTIEGLTVDGSVAGSTVPSNSNNCAIGETYPGGPGDFGCWFGISFWGASGTIENNYVVNMNNGPSFDYASIPGWGYGIFAGTPAGTPNAVTVSGNTVSDYVENGITCIGTGMTCSISDNTVSTYTPAEVGVISNGIEIVFGATGTITYNMVSGNACTATALQTALWNDIEYAPYPLSDSPCGPSPYQFASTGILTQASTGVSISYNILTSNDVGIYLTGDAGAVTATYNTISYSTYDGVFVTGESSPVTISSNAISSTLCSAWLAAQDTNQPSCGPDLISDYQADGIATSKNTGSITISGNTLTSNDVGIYLYGDTGTITTTLNGISGSTYVGVAVYDESQTVSGNAFSSEPVGIEAVSDTSGLTATATVSGDTFSLVTLWTATEIANGGTAYAEVPSGTAVTCLPTSFTIGSSSQCTASVSGKSSPTGTVTFTQSVLGSVTFPKGPTCTLASGSCSIPITGATAGTFTITATYSGDSSNAGSFGTTTTLTVTTIPTTTKVSCIQASFTIGSTSTCTAYVSGELGEPSPTGTVTFTQSVLGSVTFPKGPTCTLASGSCYITVTGATVGSFTITATYSGDSNNAESHATTSQLTVNKATTTTTLNCGGSVTFGNTATCTATVSGEYGSISSETISFTASGAGVFSSSTCTLSGATCSVTYTPANTGTQKITATYPGDSNNAGSSGQTELAVNPVLAPPTTISCSPSPVLVGRTTICKATVLGSPTPTGTVTWGGASSLGSFSTSTCKLRYGSCSVWFVTTYAGEATITATYSGNHPTSSGTFNLIVSQATSKTSVSCSTRTVRLGSTTTCTAVVTGYHPTGTVTWTATAFGLVSFANNLNTCTLTGGRCSVTMTAEGAGEVVLYATYSGGTNNIASSHSVTLVIPRDKTTLSVSCTTSSEGVGSSSMICTATLKGYSPTSSVSGETISWSQISGKGIVSFSPTTCTLSSGGTCSVTVTGVKIGGFRIEAVYIGDTNNAQSQLSISGKIT